MQAIKTTELTKKYGDKTAVDHLNLEIGKGELLSLLGVNGAGKTTTIKMLCGLAKPTSGDAELMGASVLHNPAAVKKIINVSPQETAVARALTVSENLILAAGIYGSDRAEAKKRADEMISVFGLGEYAKKKAKILSGGTQRRLSIAMALISEPEILFLDEPTLGLDVIARRSLWDAIEALKGKMTVILTTHYLEEAEALSDRIAIMAEGRLVRVGTAAELTEYAGERNFEDAFIKLAAGGAVK